MNNKEINKIYQENWNHDKYNDINKEEKSMNLSKNTKPKKNYNRFPNDHNDNSTQMVNSKTLLSDYIEQPKKQQGKKQNVFIDLTLN